MSKHSELSAVSELSGFGKEVGLIHEMLLTGAKVEAGKFFYAALAHDEELFANTVEFVRNSLQGVKYIPAPLEWSSDIGELWEGALFRRLEEDYSKDGWRLPTDGELSMALRADKGNDFETWKYYWTSTPHFDGHGFTITYRHHEGLGSMSHKQLPRSGQKYPRLRLCREKKID